MVDKDWLSVQEIAGACGVSVPTLYQWRKRNYGPPYFPFGGRVRYPRREFKRWLAAQKKLA